MNILNIKGGIYVHLRVYFKHHYTCPMCEKVVHIQAGFYRFSIMPNECEGFLHSLDKLFQELLLFKSSMRLRTMLEFPNSVRE